MDFRRLFEDEFHKLVDPYEVRGFVTTSATIIPLGTDTKVLSTVFESIARPAVKDVADAEGFRLHEALRQNSYPDFTLLRSKDDKHKIAVDVKTTYRASSASSISYTLGSYTSFLRDERRGIEFPYSDYVAHWIVAFVYSRPEKESPADLYKLDELETIPPPFSDVEMFVRQKWEIAGDKAGSGNTANIGSRRGTFAELRDGDPLFADETEFLSYWRTYERTAALRAETYANVEKFRELRSQVVDAEEESD